VTDSLTIRRAPAFAFVFALAFAVILRACDFFVCHSERSEEPPYLSLPLLVLLSPVENPSKFACQVLKTPKPEHKNPKHKQTKPLTRQK
jgi:hypothetical protein